MKCTFYRPEKTNLNEYRNIIGKMQYDLLTLDKSTDPLDVYYYVLSLCRNAKPLNENSEMCFWGLADPETMPSDARVDFFYRPTYMAAAFIMKAIVLFPELLSGDMAWEFEDECQTAVREVFPKTLLGCTGRAFMGSGYGDIDGLLDTMAIFSQAGTDEFVKKHPDFCPVFTQQYNDAMQFIRSKVNEGEWRGTWGEDYHEKAIQILK